MHIDDLYRETIPAESAAAVTPSDATVLERVKGLYIANAGNLAVTMKAGGNVTFAVPDGTILPIRVTKVLATGTTATGIVALQSAPL